jgi:primosomal protein N' (replication factor Y)
MSQILRIAIPAPLRSTFDYLPPKNIEVDTLQPGQRVRVPFGRQEVCGVITGLDNNSDIPRHRLKAVHEVLDSNDALIPADLLELLLWCSRYYHHPVGEVITAALPGRLRQGRPAENPGRQSWLPTTTGLSCELSSLSRAPRQQHLMELLQGHRDGLQADELDTLSPNWRDAMARLVDKSLVEIKQLPCLADNPAGSGQPDVHLNADQQQAVDRVTASLDRFQTYLLDGVTGSGKTEVYLEIIQTAIAKGKQALVLVPEISLTPQTVTRFRNRFQQPIAVLHSGLNDQERLCAWLSARDSRAPIVIGTRSAVFTPMPNLGVIIIDEEHDASFKQQDGFRYHARDVAVMRARNAGIPVILGSATPSLESLYNASEERYQRLHLPNRVASAKVPPVHILDIRQQTLSSGMSPQLLEIIRQHLQDGGQTLLFLNRRGYAPTLMCHGCGWTAACQRCDARLTLHQGRQRLCCHHCGHEAGIPSRCPECGEALHSYGQGTERIEEALGKSFPDVGITRVDRDSTRRQGSMEKRLDEIHRGEARLLIGTQMLAKGHHFPDVSLVAILDIDQGLYSADYRASERMAQLIIQVAGRAGRADRPGEVYVQTHHPDHPLLKQGYGAFAEKALQERCSAELPPCSHMALLRAEAVDRNLPLSFLEQARHASETLQSNQVSLLGPVPAPMEKRAGRYRAQLMVQSRDRAALHNFLTPWLNRLDELPSARRVRWSVDVDPVDMM